MTEQQSSMERLSSRFQRGRILSDIDLSAHGNSIIPKGILEISRISASITTLPRLRPRTKPLLHLDIIIDTRRARPGRRGKMRGTVIPGNKVRRGPILLSIRAGKLEFGKQAADDGKTGTYEPDGGLDMRPQRRLVHGVGVIGGVNPEQHDDTIDTSETDEDPQRKDTIERKLILPCALQVPDHGHGQREDNEVDDDVEDLVGNEELVGVEAFGVGGVGVPGAFKGAALQGTGDNDARAPGNDEGVEGEGEMLEFGGREDAAVEADDGSFDGGADEEVGELVGNEELIALVLLVFPLS